MDEDSLGGSPIVEEREIEQFATIGPSLLVRWFVDGSLVIEVGAGFGAGWGGVAVEQFGSRDEDTPLIIRLEPRSGV